MRYETINQVMRSNTNVQSPIRKGISSSSSFAPAKETSYSHARARFIACMSKANTSPLNKVLYICRQAIVNTKSALLEQNDRLVYEVFFRAKYSNNASEHYVFWKKLHNVCHEASCLISGYARKMSPRTANENSRDMGIAHICVYVCFLIYTSIQEIFNHSYCSDL